VQAGADAEVFLGLRPDDHYFCRFDQGCCGFSDFQAHLTYCVGRDNRSDVLAADGESYLGHQSADLYLDHAAHQLIAAADFAEIGSALAHFTPACLLMEKPIQLFFWNPVMATGGCHRSDLALVNPLLQRRVTDPEDLSGFARRE
jgi:hypothetical protein